MVSCLSHFSDSISHLSPDSFTLPIHPKSCIRGVEDGGYSQYEWFHSSTHFFMLFLRSVHRSHFLSEVSACCRVGPPHPAMKCLMPWIMFSSSSLFSDLGFPSVASQFIPTGLHIQHFLPFVKYTFWEVPPIWLRSLAMSHVGLQEPTRTDWNQMCLIALGISSQRSLLQPLLQEHWYLQPAPKDDLKKGTAHKKYWRMHIWPGVEE